MKRKIVVPLLALALAVPALAQDAEPGTTADTLMELREEAHRLTVLAEVPEEGRAEAEALWERFDALGEREMAQEISRLEAYIAALRSGDSPEVAREVADSQVAQDGVDLARERETLQADLQAFLETYPDAAAAMRPGRAQGLTLYSPDGGHGMVVTLPGRAGFGPASGSFRLALPYGLFERGLSHGSLDQLPNLDELPQLDQFPHLDGRPQLDQLPHLDGRPATRPSQHWH